jgi:hypothetical protein
MALLDHNMISTMTYSTNPFATLGVDMCSLITSRKEGIMSRLELSWKKTLPQEKEFQVVSPSITSPLVLRFALAMIEALQEFIGVKAQAH